MSRRWAMHIYIVFPLVLMAGCASSVSEPSATTTAVSVETTIGNAVETTIGSPDPATTVGEETQSESTTTTVQTYDPRIAQYLALRQSGATLAEFGASYVDGFPEIRAAPGTEVIKVVYGTHNERRPGSGHDEGTAAYVWVHLSLQSTDVVLHEALEASLGDEWALDPNSDVELNFTSYTRPPGVGLRSEKLFLFERGVDPASGFQQLDVGYFRVGDGPMEPVSDWVGDAPLPAGGELVASEIEIAVDRDGEPFFTRSSIYFYEVDEVSLMRTALDLLPTTEYRVNPNRPVAVDEAGDPVEGYAWLVDVDGFGVELSTWSFKDPSTAWLKLWSRFTG